MNREGELKPANREWHERNGTYRFAYALGSVIVAFGVMIAIHPWLPRVVGDRQLPGFRDVVGDPLVSSSPLPNVGCRRWAAQSMASRCCPVPAAW